MIWYDLVIWQVIMILYYKILGWVSCKRSSDDDIYVSGELKLFYEKNE